MSATTENSTSPIAEKAESAAGTETQLEMVSDAGGKDPNVSSNEGQAPQSFRSFTDLGMEDLRRRERRIAVLEKKTASEDGDESEIAWASLREELHEYRKSMGGGLSEVVLMRAETRLVTIQQLLAFGSSPNGGPRDSIELRRYERVVRNLWYSYRGLIRGLLAVHARILLKSNRGPLPSLLRHLRLRLKPNF